MCWCGYLVLQVECIGSSLRHYLKDARVKNGGSAAVGTWAILLSIVGLIPISINECSLCVDDVPVNLRGLIAAGPITNTCPVSAASGTSQNRRHTPGSVSHVRGARWMCHDRPPSAVGSFQVCCDAINECRRTVQLQGAVAWLTWQGSKELRPNIVVHGAVTSACEKSSQWLEAAQQLATVVKVGLRRDVVLQNNVMNAGQKGLKGPSLCLCLLTPE